MTNRIIYNVNIPRFFVSHRLPMALAARDAGYDVHVMTSDIDDESIEQIKAHDFPFHPLPLAQHGTNPRNELQTLQAMTEVYKTLSPDIVHHVSIKPVLYGGIAARRAGVKAVVGAMSGLGRVFSDKTPKMTVIRQMVKPMFRLALGHPNTKMIFQNPDDLRRFLVMNLIKREQAVVIKGSGVDMNVFTPQPETDEKPVVLFAGRLMWKKGIREFVTAAEALHERARFVVVGYAEATSPDAVPESDLQAWVNNGWIEWWGKRDDMPDVFAQSHIVCLPSSYGEGVPKVLIEAAACGRPIVATDAAGCREITQDGFNGFLFQIGDIDGLIHAITRLLDNPELRHEMGQNGRQLVMSEFSLEIVTQATLDVYQQLLERA